MAQAFARFPDVRDRQVVFVADDDIWMVPLAGGTASRLTSDHAACWQPRFSPDGTKVAYGSAKDDVGEIYVLDLTTGTDRRLTWVGAGPGALAVAGWVDDEHVLLGCAAREYMSTMRMFSLSLDGDMDPLDLGIAETASFHPSGAVVTTTPNYRESSMWKRYRGGTAAKMWLNPTGKGPWQRLLPDVDAGCYCPTFFGDRIVFTSDLGGDLPQQPQAQLWSVDLTGGDLRQHTHHTEAQGYVRHVRTDGKTLVYDAHGRLYSMTSLGAKPKLLDVQVPVDAPTTSLGHGAMRDIRPDHGADLSVAEWQGAVYALTSRSGPVRRLVDDARHRAREPRVLGQTGTAIYAVDLGEQDVLEVAPLNGEGKPRRLAQGKLGYVTDIASSPDGGKVAVASHDGAVRIVTIGTGRIKEILSAPHGEAQGLTWSPDGRWIAWRHAVGEWMQGRIAIAEAATGTIHFLTSGHYDDTSPSFSLDGKYLLFLSNRTFDPIYDAHTFDLSFGDSMRPYLVPLQAQTPAPFSPSIDGWRISEVVAARAAEASDSPSEEKKEAGVTVSIDLDGIAERIVPLPVPVGSYSLLQCAKDGVLWLHHPSDTTLGITWTGAEGEKPKPSIERYGFTSRKLETLGVADSFRVSGDGQRLLVRHKADVLVVPSDRKVGDDDPLRVGVDLSRARRRVDLREQMRQMMTETHRLMRDNFWREDMDGVDWDGVLQRYLPLVDRMTTKAELVDTLWEMVGELNTGHAYIYGAPPAPRPTNAAQLGADLRRRPDGTVEIIRILATDLTDPHAVSPLQAPGVAAKAGDVIVAVDGRRLDADTPLGELLLGAAGKVVELTLRRGRTERRVAVQPITGERALRYHDWVDSRKRYVTEKSGGRLGYIHVPDMGASGWAQFHRDIDEATRREGVIADMRWNGGGHTSQLIIERLARKIVSWQFGRHYSEPWSYWQQAPRGPVMVVTNQFAGSDGDIVNAVSQAVGLGPVIGERSWGGTIGIDGRYDLVDGTHVTQPRYPSWFCNTCWDIENHGVDPDIEVALTPDDWNDQLEVDVQLDVAIAEALRRLEETPAASPPEFPAPRVH